MEEITFGAESIGETRSIALAIQKYFPGKKVELIESNGITSIKIEFLDVTDKNKFLADFNLLLGVDSEGRYSSKNWYNILKE